MPRTKSRRSSTGDRLPTPAERGEGDELVVRLLRFMAARLSQEVRPEDCQRYEKSLYDFVRGAWHVVEPSVPFVGTWYVGCICEHLQAMTNLEITRLVLNMPPRYGKSLLTSVFWPVWVWCTSPDTRWLIATYGNSLVERDAVRCRDILMSPWYQDRWGGIFSIKEDMDKKAHFATDRQGYRIGTTITGLGTGHGGGYILADDPHKQLEVHSTAKRNVVLNWWDKTMSTRGDPGYPVRFLITMQRLRQNDLAGHVLAQKLGYEHLCLPCEYEPGRVVYSWPLPADEDLPRDPIIPTKLQRRRTELADPRVEAGELLCPELHDRAEVEMLKLQLRQDAAGQLQQRPSAATGTVYERAYFKYFTIERFRGSPHVILGDDSDKLVRRIPLSALRFFQCIDTATDIEDTNAFTSIGTFALAPGYFLLVWDIWRERMKISELFGACQAFRIGPHRLLRLDDGRTTMVPCGAPWPSSLLYQAVEKKSSGINLIQQGAAEGMPFEALVADTDKVTRSGPVTTMYHNSMVWHRKGAIWLTFFEEELMEFPFGQFKDCADVMAYGGIKATHDKYLRSGLERELTCSGGEDDQGNLETDPEGRQFRFGYGDESVTVLFPDD